MNEKSLNTPVGPLCVMSEDGAIVALDWRQARPGPVTPELNEAIAQLGAYFDGRLKVFDLPLNVTGSPFQRQVCDQIYAIPFGETRTYGDLAKALNAPAQAIGGGCGGNPIPVIIPCHRVLGATSLGGFSGRGGVEAKVWLLRHEKAAGLLI